MEPTQSFNRPITATTASSPSTAVEPVALEDVVIADDSPSQDIAEAGNDVEKVY